MRALEITATGIEDLQDYFDKLPEVTQEAARIAVNETADFARALAARRIGGEFNLTRSYLSDAEGRLKVTRRARGDDLEAVITGRDRPTSLARFGIGSRTIGKRRANNPVRVRVLRSGGDKTLNRGFYIRLRAGKTLDDANFNVGLAVRLRKGERLTNKREAVLISSGLYLLFGPSVGQIFSSVSEDIVPDVLDKLETEFVRQFNRLSPNG